MSEARALMENEPGALAEQFESIGQQRDAARLGMWIFLATEVMFFGGLFAGYAVYRVCFPEVFHAASHRLDVLSGALDTAVLLCSSLTMALGVRAVRLGQRRRAAGLLVATAALGAGFLVLHGFEYWHEWHEHLVPGAQFRWEGAEAGRAQMFFWIYFALTGLHSLHVLIGAALMLVLAVLVWNQRIDRDNPMAAEVSGLYWHFVDIVWVFLFPLLYLAGAR